MVSPVSDIEEEPANLRLLRRLVTTLMVVMILGLLTIVGLFVMRFASPAPPGLPQSIALPDGATPMAFTQGPDWYAVVTTDSRILIYGLDGTLSQEIRITR